MIQDRVPAIVPYYAAGEEAEELIDLGGGRWIKIKTELTRAELREAENAMNHAVVDAKGLGRQGGASTDVTITPDVALYRDLMVQHSLLDWNLGDRYGSKLALNVSYLKGPDFDAVYNRVKELNARKTEEEQARFPDEG